MSGTHPGRILAITAQLRRIYLLHKLKFRPGGTASRAEFYKSNPRIQAVHSGHPCGPARMARSYPRDAALPRGLRDGRGDCRSDP